MTETVTLRMPEFNQRRLQEVAEEFEIDATEVQPFLFGALRALNLVGGQFDENEALEDEEEGPDLSWDDARRIQSKLHQKFSQMFLGLIARDA